MSPLLRVLRWLVRADEPAPIRPAADVAAEMARNYRWNFVVQALDFGLFWFASSFASSTTILPLFVSKLTTSTLPIGLVAVVAQGGWYLPQLFTANLIERLPRMKPVVVNLGFFLERVPFFLIVAAPVFALKSPEAALVLLLVGWTWHNVGAGIIAPAWQDLVARCFPVERRGRFFGVAAFLGAGAGALGAGVSAWLLAELAFPLSFVAVLGIAAAGITLSWVFLALTREPVQGVASARRSQSQYLAELPDLVRGDRNFARFLLARLLLAAGGMAIGFVTVAAVQRWHLPDSQVGLFTAAMLVGQTAGNLGFGLLADRRGNLMVLRLGSAASVLAYAAAWAIPVPELFWIVFVFLGLGASSTLISGILVVMEFAPADRRPTYVGITNTGVGLVGGAAPFVGAALASLSYDALFVASLLACVGSLVVFTGFVKEPRTGNA